MRLALSRVMLKSHSAGVEKTANVFVPKAWEYDNRVLVAQFMFVASVDEKCGFEKSEQK